MVSRRVVTIRSDRKSVRVGANIFAEWCWPSHTTTRSKRTWRPRFRPSVWEAYVEPQESWGDLLLWRRPARACVPARAGFTRAWAARLRATTKGTRASGRTEQYWGCRTAREYDPRRLGGEQPRDLDERAQRSPTCRNCRKGGRSGWERSPEGAASARHSSKPGGSPLPEWPAGQKSPTSGRPKLKESPPPRKAAGSSRRVKRAHWGRYAAKQRRDRSAGPP